MATKMGLNILIVDQRDGYTSECAKYNVMNINIHINRYS
jgi:hypothetical protein